MSLKGKLMRCLLRWSCTAMTLFASSMLYAVASRSASLLAAFLDFPNLLFLEWNDKWIYSEVEVAVKRYEVFDRIALTA